MLVAGRDLPRAAIYQLLFQGECSAAWNRNWQVGLLPAARTAPLDPSKYVASCNIYLHTPFGACQKVSRRAPVRIGGVHLQYVDQTRIATPSRRFVYQIAHHIPGPRRSWGICLAAMLPSRVSRHSVLSRWSRWSEDPHFAGGRAGRARRASAWPG